MSPIIRFLFVLHFIPIRRFSFTFIHSFLYSSPPPSSVFLSPTSSFPHIPHRLSSSSRPSSLQPTSLLPPWCAIYLWITLTHPIFKFNCLYCLSFLSCWPMILQFPLIPLILTHNSYIFCNSFDFLFYFWTFVSRLLTCRSADTSPLCSLPFPNPFTFRCPRLSVSASSSSLVARACHLLDLVLPLYRNYWFPFFRATFHRLPLLTILVSGHPDFALCTSFLVVMDTCIAPSNTHFPAPQRLSHPCQPLLASSAFRPYFRSRLPFILICTPFPFWLDFPFPYFRKLTALDCGRVLGSLRTFTCWTLRPYGI